MLIFIVGSLRVKLYGARAETQTHASGEHCISPCSRR